ncbi:PqqD family protein [Deinococcus sp. VB343]|uniref:PqqD family protein n=1 Tax=Deinococcus sp. VB343 TaxID=3385567 RepID=UPI0039C93EF8
MTTFWTANPDVLVTDLGDELVLMHPGRSEMFSLNAAGRLLWQALPATPDTLTDLLAGHYGLGRAQAQADTAAVLSDLQARDLVRQS